MSHAAALASILAREQARQEAARLHAHDFRPVPTRPGTCSECGLGSYGHGRLDTKGEAR